MGLGIVHSVSVTCDQRTYLFPMRIRLEELRRIIQEDLKNVHSKHEKTVKGSTVLRKIHDAPGVMESLTMIDDPKELAHIIEALIDAVPIVRKGEVLRALGIVQRHEKKARR